MAGAQQIVLKPGVILVAPPALIDPNFRKSVVLLCEHTDEGSFGLILNRMISLDMADVVEELATYTNPVHFGGPVQINTLHFLHRLGEELDGGVPLFGDISWGGDFERLQEIVTVDAPRTDHLRFFLGYAGWIAGQLDAEVEAGGWILLPSRVEMVFSANPEDLWRQTMRRMGGEYAMLANFPDDPRMN